MDEYQNKVIHILSDTKVRYTRIRRFIEVVSMEEKPSVSHCSSCIQVTITVLIGQSLIHLGLAVICFIDTQQYNSSNPTPWDTFMAGSNTLTMILFLVLALPSLWLASELWKNRLHSWFRILWATLFLFAGIPYIPTIIGPYLAYAVFGLVFLVTSITLFVSLYHTSRDGWLTSKPYPEPGS